jgi:hypothetical protein
MLDEDPVLDTEDVCPDPVRGHPEPGEATMHDDEVAGGDVDFRTNGGRLVNGLSGSFVVDR